LLWIGSTDCDIYCATVVPVYICILYMMCICAFAVYVPEPNFLTRELRRQPILHDENFASRHFICDSDHDMLAMP